VDDELMWSRVCFLVSRKVSDHTNIFVPISPSGLRGNSLSPGEEQSAVSRTGCIVAHHLPTRTENISFSLEFSGPLVANLLFPPIFCMPVPY